MVDLNCLKIASKQSDAHAEMTKCLEANGGRIADNIIRQAALDGHIEIVKFLVEKGGKIGDSAIEYAASRGYIEIVKFLFEKGGKFDLDAIGSAAYMGHLEVLEYLVDKCNEKIDFRIVDYAARGGHLEVVRFLVEKDIKIGDHSIEEIASKGYIEIIKFLVKKGGKIGDFAIEDAAKYGHLETVKFLVEKGGKIGDSAVKAATAKGHIEIVKFLVEKGGKIGDAVATASFDGHIEIVKFLVEKGGKIGDSVATAAFNGHTEIVKLLVEKGGKVRDSVVKAATAKGQIEIVKFLVEKSGKIDGDIISEAVNGGHLEIVKLLVEKGAKFDSVVVEFAARHGYMEPAKLGWEKGYVDSLTASTYISDSHASQQNTLSRNVQFHNYGSYALFKTSGAKETALVINGYDNNGAFRNDKTIDMLLSKGFDILHVNALKKTKSLEDIKVSIVEGLGASKLTHLFIEMHGGPNSDRSDTILTLNQHSDINALDLLSLVTKELGNAPLKVVISSCHGQLATQGIEQILAKNSEVVTYMEDQIVGNFHFDRSGNDKDLKEIVFSRKNLMSPDAIHLAQLPSLYSLFHNSNFKITSPTYTKIGICKTKSIVTISDTEFEEMLSTVSKERLVQDVKTFICYRDEECNNDISEGLEAVLPLLEQSPMPLLTIRDSAIGGKAMAIGNAIYQLYGPCNVVRSLKEAAKDFCDVVSEYMHTNSSLIEESFIAEEL